MGGGIGQMLRSASLALFVVLLLLTMLTCMQAGKAYARANLATYMTLQPNSWEMSGYNVNGTAAKLTVDTIGWNATKMIGNVGLGDGSVSALKQTSNKAVNFSENNYMAGDVSETPWDPGRINNLNTMISSSNENNSAKSIDSKTDNTDINSSAPDNKTVETEKNASENVTGSNMGNIALNDVYHAILMGRPTDDLLYEDPRVITGTVYSRFIGLRMPGGGCLNIGMRTLGYGY